jgi:hypothetical protein
LPCGFIGDINYLYRNGEKVKLFNLRVIEEVIINRKKEIINKERLSEKIKTQMQNRKKKRSEVNDYLTAQKLVKDYREKQKSHANFKRKVYHTKTVGNFFDSKKDGRVVIVIRIAG